MTNEQLITVLLAVTGGLVGILIAVLGWVGSSMQNSMKEIAHDVSGMKSCIVEYFTELRNHKESTKEKFAEQKTQIERIEATLIRRSDV